MAATLLEQTRALHEDIERLEYAASQFLLEDPKNYKDSVNQGHQVSQVLDLIIQKREKLLEIYKDVDNSRQNDISALTVRGVEPLFSFYERYRDIKDYHRRYPDITVTNPQEILENITGSANVPFTFEEGSGKYLDLNEFLTTFNNFPWIQENPIDYFTYLNIAFKFSNILQGKGKDYLDYLQKLYEYTTDFIRRSQPLFDLASILSSFESVFNEKWDKGEFITTIQPIVEGASTNLHLFIDRTYCFDCRKKFAKSTVFNAHLKGKKHLALAKKNVASDKQTAKLQFQLQNLGDHLAEQVSNTKIHVETKLARRYEDIEAEIEEELEPQESESDSDEEEEMTRRCITNYPVGWDGKPIPYWLYKLHGLGIEYKCEICGNTSYFGRRAYERHFQEWRHAYGMRCLGIPNSKHFHEITYINDALALWEKIKKDRQEQEWHADDQEEYEDDEGNVMIKKTYKDLERQGFL